MVESTFHARALLYLKSDHFVVFLCKEREKYVLGFTILILIKAYCFVAFMMSLRSEPPTSMEPSAFRKPVQML